MATTLTQSQTKDESQTEDGTQAHTPAALPPLPHKPVRIPTAQLSSQPIVNRRCLQQQVSTIVSTDRGEIRSMSYSPTERSCRRSCHQSPSAA